MPPVHDQALCIRSWEWSETSQTLSLFSRTMGIVRGLAKGSRRPNAAFSGGIDLLTRGRFGVIVRPNSELALITEWDLVQTFPALRTSLAVHHAGLYVADLIHHMVRDHDPHTPLYDITVATLAGMASSDDIPEALLRFQWSVLDECGFRPVVEDDVNTQSPLAPARTYRFDPNLGGFLADPPEDAGPDHPAAGAWRVRGETRAVLAAIASPENPSDLAPSALALERANRLLASYIRHVLGTEPPTMPVIFGHRLAR